MNFFETKVLKIIKETSDTYSYVLEVPEGMTWKAGQHCMYKFKDHKVDEGDKETRVFSVASSIEDGFIMFTTRIADPHTSFKEILLNKLQVGDTMMITQPIGNFNVSESPKKSLIIAGGIGITPVRSIFRHLQKNNMENKEFTVFYSDDRGEFAYVETFEEIKKDMPNLDFHFISDRNEFTEKVETFVKEVQNGAEYLIAGSPGMNAFFTEKLMGMGIEKQNIKIDNFMGY